MGVVRLEIYSRMTLRNDLRIITSNKKYSSVLLQIKVLINTFFVSGYFENHSLWAYNVQKMCERYNQKCRNGA